MASMPMRRRVVLCADFDQTLTSKDTIALLFRCAAARQRSAHARAAHEAHVQRLVAQYASEMSTFLDEFHARSSIKNGATAVLNTGNGPPAHASIGAQGTDPACHGGSRFDARGLHAFLDGYAAADLQSITRVVDAELLRGIHRQDLVQRASEIALLPKSVDVLAASDASYVVSSNWSVVMLDATLNRIDSGRRRTIKIIANDLEMDAANRVSTGAIQLRVQSPRDKAHWVQRIRADEAPPSLTQEPVVVFVGDSTNDLLAMVEADVGIALAPSSGSESSFVQLADRFGVELEPISSRTSLAECARASLEAKAQGRQLLFTAGAWAEIGACVSG